MDDYRDLDALGLAELIRKKETTALEVLESALDRAQARNGEINAITAFFEDAARQRAAEPFPETPLAGVPFLVKDLVYIEGVPCTYGSRLYAENVPDHDATVVKRAREAGLVIFGKTNTPEFGLNVATEPALFGPTRNPWNTDHVPGGSSGGAGAAVADGWLPVAHATDGGGSIRIPAACCGLVGLKPSRARNPQGPDVGEGWSGMSTGHVVSRSVRDSAAFLDAFHGPEPGDPYAAPHFEGAYLERHHESLKRLKIAVDLNALTGQEVHPECIAAVEHAAALCESLGHEVAEGSPEFDREPYAMATSTLVAGNIAMNVNNRLKALGRALKDDDIEPHTRMMWEIGSSLSAEDYARALQVIHQTGRATARFHRDWDLMLTPVLLSPPVPVGWLDTVSYDQAQFNERFVRFWGFTNLQNATGQPAISLPLHWSAEGLPVGVQFVSAYGDELTLLKLARQLEGAQPWFDRVPGS
ncbi:MAG: amidase [Gammaproteobacteria bacterium]|nr:MAG: amidase [Gammaproteobacteria bacterium]